MPGVSAAHSVVVSETARALGDAIRLQGALGGAVSGGLLRLREGGRVDILAAWPSFDGSPALWMQEAAGLFAGHAGESRSVAYASQQSVGGHIAVVPCASIGEPDVAAVFLLRERDEQTLAEDVGRLELGLAALRSYQASQEAQRRTEDVDRLASAIEIAGVAGAHLRFESIAFALVNEIASRYGCERVSLGMLGRVGHGDVRLRAMSASDRVVRKTELAHSIERAMDEALDQDIETVWPEPDDAGAVTRCLRGVVHERGECGLVMPLRTAEGLVGALLLERGGDRVFTQREIETLRLVLELVSARLWERWERDRWIGARAVYRAHRGLAWAVGAQHTWAKVIALVVIAFVCFSVFVKTTDEVRAPFVVEPLERRKVSAPFDGFLREVLVRVGDRVEPGQLMARLDDTVLRLQLADERARERAARTQADAARSGGEIAEARVAEAQREQAMARVRLLEHMIEQAQIVAPVGGVVISGELESVVGGPVGTGELLFEIADPEAVRVGIAVPERAMMRVEAGQMGRLALAADPQRKIQAEIVRIDPVASGERGARSFRAIASAEGMGLRPGMEGIARIETGRASYARVWLRPMTDWLRMRLWF